MAPQLADQGILNVTSSCVLAGKICDKAFFLSYATIDKGQAIGFVQCRSL